MIWVCLILFLWYKEYNILNTKVIYTSFILQFISVIACCYWNVHMIYYNLFYMGLYVYHYFIGSHALGIKFPAVHMIFLVIQVFVAGIFITYVLFPIYNCGYGVKWN